MAQLAFWRVCLALGVAYLIQTTYLAQLLVYETRCDLLLVVVVCVALLGGQERGAWCGFLAGVLSGYAGAWHLGSFIVSRVAAGAAVGYLPRKVSTENAFAPIICAVLGTLVADLVFLVMSPTNFSLTWWLRHTIVSCLLHATVAYPLYFLLKKFLCPTAKFHCN